MVGDGIGGVTANPTILAKAKAKAIGGSADYDEQLSWLIAAGCSVEGAYWELVVTDSTGALAVLRPGFDATGGADGFVSVEVAPELARDTAATIAAARRLHARIDEPNLMVKIPATAEGVPAIEAMIAEGRSINITLIFSLTRYAEVIDAYLSGLETFTDAGGDPATVRRIASSVVSRVDPEVDRRLDAVGGDEALRLRRLTSRFHASFGRPSRPIARFRFRRATLRMAARRPRLHSGQGRSDRLLARAHRVSTATSPTADWPSSRRLIALAIRRARRFATSASGPANSSFTVVSNSSSQRWKCSSPNGVRACTGS